MSKYGFLLLLLVVPLCSEERVEEVEPNAAVKLETTAITKPIHRALNDTALLFSGRPLEKISSLYKYSQSPRYKRHRRLVQQSWQRYRRKTFAKIAAFSSKNLQYGSTIFYPFGGPDLVNALALFDKAESYILLGLEPIGRIPQTNKLAALQLNRGLTSLRAMLARILGHNFFHTKVMAKKVGATSFTSIASIMMYFISSAGYDIEKAGLIMIDKDGNQSRFNKKSARGKITGLRIDFVKDGISKQVYYFRGNVSDEAFSKKKGLINFLYQKNELTTMLKAASYLMYRNSFDDIRNLILTRSRVIVQDPSGFPYHFLRNKKGWHVQLFGSYVKPIPLFRIRCQPDLRLDSRKKTKRALPFAYGYTSPTYGKSMMIYATKQGHVTLPKFDGSMQRGVNTYCTGNKLVVDKK